MKLGIYNQDYRILGLGPSQGQGLGPMMDFFDHLLTYKLIFAIQKLSMTKHYKTFINSKPRMSKAIEENN